MIFHQPSNSMGNYHFNATNYTAEEYAPHFHKNLEVLFVQQGTAVIVVSGVSVTIRQGEMAMVLSNQIHSFSVGEDSCLWVAVFSEDFVPKFAADTKGRQGNTSRFVPSEAVTRLVQECLVERDSSLLMKKACLYALCDAYNTSVTWEARTNKTDFLVGSLLDWLAEHYAEDVTLKGAAQHFGYEYHYFSQLLSSRYGVNFRRLLNQYRVEAAIDLLEHTSLPITDIALKSGFQTIRSFNHVFHEYVGNSPREYREK